MFSRIIAGLTPASTLVTKSDEEPTSYTPVRTEADRASGDPPMSGLQDSPRLDPAGSVEPP